MLKLTSSLSQLVYAGPLTGWERRVETILISKRKVYVVKELLWSDVSRFVSPCNETNRKRPCMFL
jgi:hypothetical protein